ncbi:ATP-dependent RNA/DNA helicase IGHMBP2 [Marchantia polymorpha subsp. ruderalis]|uniref:DNA helicase n=2 Tax=Marchantia polymorpha TaxID=3197 RepID=A0AAF6AN53_MARPO|nr:hypothetical protein MARPO_0036s0146 [Marchantia polymorpha]BBM97873.1 hypothetical protein Mp_1g09060 [Marchantia polymorpha subsp. ruderalis]|eukprot:PTQ41175.1 hypothetical protein MARPO_0036s0146 [Marchantia polymorpha]
MAEKKGSAGTSGHSPPVPKMVTLEEFVSRTVPLIQLEKDAEIAASVGSLATLKPEAAEKKGVTLLNLKCSDVQTGLFGKTVLELKPNRGELLPPHKMTPHDVVVLKLNKSDSASTPLAQGVVYRVKDGSIVIAVEDVPEDGLNSPLRLEKLANEVTYKRLKDTLIELSKGVNKGPATELVPVLFGAKAPSFAKKQLSFTPFNRDLDHSQRAAIAKALISNNVMLLHGPPGTGKTTTVVELILQEVKRESKVLVCAASNIAVDNIVERLACHKVLMVRLGHPARLLPQVLDSALDAKVMKADNSALANDVRKEMRVISSKLLKAKDRKTRGDLRRELRNLSKEERQRQQQAVTDVIKDSSVICTTLTGALSRQLNQTNFDVVIIDEAAQALEVACWIALLKGRRCILAGDHLQLPPTVQSVEAEKKGLGITLFGRLAALYGDQITSMLTVQYRMNELIMGWSSGELYDNKIEAHDSVKDHTLSELDGVTSSSAVDPTLILIDTAGCDLDEVKDDADSTMNEGEAKVAVAHALRLLDAGVKASDIGIITPYNAQVGVLRLMRAGDKKLADIEISSVDGFQGREKEAIIISMVRSNEKHEVGFLSDNRRMNVAVTRARRQCVIICDTETVYKNPFLKRLGNYFEENGEYLSAMEYLK